MNCEHIWINEEVMGDNECALCDCRNCDNIEKCGTHSKHVHEECDCGHPRAMKECSKELIEESDAIYIFFEEIQTGTPTRGERIEFKQEELIALRDAGINTMVSDIIKLPTEEVAIITLVQQGLKNENSVIVCKRNRYVISSKGYEKLMNRDYDVINHVEMSKRHRLGGPKESSLYMRRVYNRNREIT